MDAAVYRVIELDNSWLLGVPVDRWCAEHLPAHFVPRLSRPEPGDRVVLVVGPRQAGKSSLIWKHLRDSGKPFLYLDCEEPAVRQWLDSPAAFLSDVASLRRPPLPLFFDEVQRLADAGLFLKGLVDRKPGVPMFATGSSSFDLEARTRESLAGRAVRHLLLPFSVAEMTSGTDAPADPAGTRASDVVERLLVFGGYPEVVRAERPEPVLVTLVESFVIRDASDRFKVRNVAAFRKVLDLAASQIGNLVKFSEWASIAGVSNDTVAEYVRLLEETHVVRLIRPFIGGKRAEITNAPKIYFVDNGVRNLIFGGFAPSERRADHGVLLENLVLGEMLKYSNPILDSVRFWRSKAGAEVDFVFESGGTRAAVEVKAGDARGNLTRSARSFMETYEPPLFLVVNARRHPAQKIGATEVRFVRPADFHKEFRPLCRHGCGSEPAPPA